MSTTEEPKRKGLLSFLISTVATTSVAVFIYYLGYIDGHSTHSVEAAKMHLRYSILDDQFHQFRMEAVRHGFGSFVDEPLPLPTTNVWRWDRKDVIVETNRPGGITMFSNTVYLNAESWVTIATNWQMQKSK